MADDDADLDGVLDDDWNPFEVVEESREKLEALADARREAESKEFPRHLLITDPVWAREVVQRSRAEKVAEKEAKARHDVPPPEEVARLAAAEEWPSSATKTAKKMAGWDVEGWTMRGPVISTVNREIPIRRRFVLRARQGSRQVRVIYEQHEDTGKWTRIQGYGYTPGETFNWTAMGAKALDAYVADHDQPMLEAQVIE